MILDNGFNFAAQQSLSGTVAQNSTNVFDAGSAKKLFGGAGRPAKVACCVTAIGGTSPTLKAQLVGADDAALATNPIVLAEEEGGRVIVAGDLPWAFELVPTSQLDAKRYYGIIWTQTGTTPTATVNAQGCADAQSNYTGIGP